MKKIIDERGRIFGAISVIDIFAIIIIAILGIVLYTKFLSKGNDTVVTVNTTPVTYQVRIQTVRGSAAAMFREGDNLFADNGNNIGVIKSVTIKDAVIPSVLTDGTYVLAPIDERYDVYLDLEVPCSISNGRFFANRSFELWVNSEYKLLTKYSAFSGVITKISAD